MTAPAPVRPPPHPLPGVWTFFADMLHVPNADPANLGVTQLGPVIVTAFSFTQTLNDFGAGEATILVETSALTRADLLRLWGWRLWALYDGQPVFCGWPTGLSDSGGATVTVSLSEVTAYLDKRYFDIRDILTEAQGGGRGHYYHQVEQTQLAATLAGPLNDVLVTVSHGGSPVHRDRTYTFLEDKRSELLKALAGVGNGPQFRTEYGWQADGYPHATFRIAHPRVGTDTGAGAAVPGNVRSFTLAWNADLLRTWTWAVGDLRQNAPQTAEKPLRRILRPQFNTGRPVRLDGVDEWSGVVNIATLEDKAETSARLYAQPALTIEVTVGAEDPRLTSYQVGDTVTIHITDPLLAGGLESQHGTLTAREVSAGDGSVSWTVAIEEPPPKARETAIGTLNRIDNFTLRSWRRDIAAEVDLP